MRRKKAITGAAAIVLAATTLLAGCTPSAAPAAGGDTTTELTVWHYYSVDGQVAGLDALGDDFEANNPGTKITNVYVPFDQLTSKLVQAAGTNSGPDVVVYNAGDTFTLKEAGAIEPMNDWWDNYADKDQFPEAVVQKVGDDVMGVQGFVNLLALWYNKTLLDQIGVKPPTTLAELDSALATAKAAGKEGITLTGKPNSEGEWQSWPWLSSFGWNYADPQASSLTQGFQLMQDWTSKGYLTKEASTWDQTVPFQQFEAGNTAFAVNGNWQIASAKTNADFEYGVIPIPVGEKGSIYLGGEAQNVGAFSKNKELAQKFLEQEFFSVKGQLTLLNAFGSIPSRADAASDPAISGDPILSVFSDVVTANGHTSPDPDIPSASVATVLQTVGESWSAAIAGNDTPQAIADKLVATLKPLLSK